MFDVFFVANIIGSVAFALSGFLVGVEKRLDYMGLFIVSLLTASGGGMLRDVLVNRVPYLLSDSVAFFLVCATILAATGLGLHKKKDIQNNAWFVLSDAIGLAAFSVTGALVAIEVGLPLFGGMALAFLTASGGGILRDILVNKMPSLLDSDFYGTISLLIAAGIYVLHVFNMQNTYTVTLVFILALVLRLVAYMKKWHLPRLRF